MLLFEIIINDMKNAVKYSSTILYANDTTILIIGSNLKFLKLKLQRHLDSIYEWLCANSLSVNASKTKCMIFSRRPYFIDIDLKMDNKSIELVSNIKILGFVIDDKLSCTDHCVHLKTNLLQNLYAIGKLRTHVPTYLL